MGVLYLLIMFRVMTNSVEIFRLFLYFTRLENTSTPALNFLLYQKTVAYTYEALAKL